MYADLGPGQTIDLHPPSPNGVDSLYSHEYVLNRVKGLRYRPPSTTAERTNLYTYVTDNPINRIDPSGLKQVCGFYVWFYTGLGWCVEESVYDAALDAAAGVVNCWWDCEVKIHCSVAGAAGIGAGGGLPLTFTHLPVAKPRDLRVIGTGDITTLQRILAERLRERGYEGIATRLHGRAAAVNQMPLGQAARIGGAGVAIVEAAFSIYCGLKCSS